MSATVDGLVSGLNTSQIISQLMQIERVPQQRLQQKLNGVQSLLDAYRSLNTKFSSIRTAAKALTAFKGFEPARATSSDETRVVASATSGAPAQSLSFTVENLAVAEQAASSGTVASTSTQVTDLASIRVTNGTEQETISVGGGTLSEVVTAVNNAGMGIRATAVKVAENQYKLHLSSTETGDAHDISVDDGSGGAAFSFSTLGEVAQVVDGEDAVLRIGGPGGYTVNRSSNTVTDLLDGVTLTLLQEDAAQTVTVSVERNGEALADKVQAMVDTVNAALSEMKGKSSFDPSTSRGGIFLGDSTVRALRNRLVSAVSDPVTGNALGAPSSAGFSMGRDGLLVFDRDEFLEAYASDPDAVEGLIGKGSDPNLGVAGRLEDLANDAIATGEGLLAVAIDGRNTEIRRLNDRIADWDTRLEVRETALRRRFSALETAVSGLQAQSSWLGGALAGAMARITKGSGS